MIDFFLNIMDPPAFSFEDLPKLTADLKITPEDDPRKVIKRLIDRAIFYDATRRTSKWYYSIFAQTFNNIRRNLRLQTRISAVVAIQYTQSAIDMLGRRALTAETCNFNNIWMNKAYINFCRRTRGWNILTFISKHRPDLHLSRDIILMVTRFMGIP
jgi:hypothetical protein